MVIHVIPVNDIHEHIEAEWCSCQPKTEGDLVIHNAWDDREVIEEVAEIFRQLDNKDGEL